ncbi:unnamed protein product [Heligmosomoides polygyrus]|uniref:Secreted protein n=1 Tax=Heligmosomoides polygyrus TaxID=6339 RepID=A0A183FJ32_HELPZ|nr:unnamed protein product [Heligmosomoides polygyrus]
MKPKPEAPSPPRFLLVLFLSALTRRRRQRCRQTSGAERLVYGSLKAMSVADITVIALLLKAAVLCVQTAG